MKVARVKIDFTEQTFDVFIFELERLIVDEKQRPVSVVTEVSHCADVMPNISKHVESDPIVNALV